MAGPAADVSKILYGGNRKLYGEPKRTVQYLWCSAAKVKYVSHLDLIHRNPGLGGSYDQQTEVMVLYARAPHTICDFYGTTF